jgi:hypothetical protein
MIEYIFVSQLSTKWNDKTLQTCEIVAPEISKFGEFGSNAIDLISLSNVSKLFIEQSANVREGYKLSVC